MMSLKTMPDIPSGGSLVERILQGDKSAEEELVQRYWPGVLEIVRARIRSNPEEAYDITQDTFVVVLQAIRADKLREREKLVGFIHGVAINLTKNFLSHEVETCELDDQQVPGRDPVELLEAAERRRKAQETIRSLSRLDQWILMMVVEGASLLEIARGLNMSPENVRQRKLRAIKKL